MADDEAKGSGRIDFREIKLPASRRPAPGRARRCEHHFALVVALRLYPDAVLEVGARRKLFGRSAHQEAVARIQYCIAESGLGVLTGDVGAGKTVAVRAAVNGLDRTSYTVIYMPIVGGCRGLYVSITRLGPRRGSTRRGHRTGAYLLAPDAEKHRKSSS